MSTPFEEEAAGILREAAKDVRVHGLPLDTAFAARLAEVVRRAYTAGGYRTAEVLADAYTLSLEGNDEILPDTLDEALPPGHPPLS
jgi:hypothetical protein